MSRDLRLCVYILACRPHAYFLLHALDSVRLKVRLLTAVGLTITSDSTQLSTVHIYHLLLVINLLLSCSVNGIFFIIICGYFVFSCLSTAAIPSTQSIQSVSQSVWGYNTFKTCGLCKCNDRS